MDKSETIFSVLEQIESREMFLPSIQRKFVWSEDKIINLFDSIMKGYPFGNFIFWSLNKKEEIHQYRFYEFIKHYSFRENTINASAGKVAKPEIKVVLDGQQRLTSLYIGIKGSLTTIEKRKKTRIAENWKKKCLYIVPLVSADERNEDETPWRFYFLEDSYVEEQNKLINDPSKKYYAVSSFYGLSKKDLYEKLGVKKVTYNKESWKRILENLRYYINEAEIINFDTIENKNIDDVLEIFKRINNGGTKLSPANLLFSTVITSWEKGRDEMDSFIETINNENIIKIREDFLVRTCVYLMNKPAAAKIEVLTEDVVKSISENWNQIKEAIVKAKNFLKQNNIFDEAILSYNALLPIIYYYYYSKETNYKDAEKQLMYFFSISQMFSLFGGSSATTLDLIRKKMCSNEELGKVLTPFALSNLYDIDLSAGRIHAFKINKEQVERLVDSVSYGDKKSYVMLSLMQPQIVLGGNYYDVDHVCSKNELKKLFNYQRGETRQKLESKKNNIVNLQLLEYRQNRTDKSDVSLYEWVVEMKNKVPFDPYENENNPELYKMDSIERFEDFHSKRRQLVIDYLCECFGIN